MIESMEEQCRRPGEHFNYASVHMHNPRCLYAVHVADYNTVLMSGQGILDMCMCVLAHCAQHRGISTTSAFIKGMS